LQETPDAWLIWLQGLSGCLIHVLAREFQMFDWSNARTSRCSIGPIAGYSWLISVFGFAFGVYRGQDSATRCFVSGILKHVLFQSFFLIFWDQRDFWELELFPFLLYNHMIHQENETVNFTLKSAASFCWFSFRILVTIPWQGNFLFDIAWKSLCLVKILKEENWALT
jgi:hypothetical protein